MLDETKHNFDGVKEFNVPNGETRVELVAQASYTEPTPLIVCVFDKDLQLDSVSSTSVYMNTAFNEWPVQIRGSVVIEHGGLKGIALSEEIPLGQGFYRNLIASSVRVYIKLYNTGLAPTFHRNVGAFITPGNHVEESYSYAAAPPTVVGPAYMFANALSIPPFARRIQADFDHTGGNVFIRFYDSAGATVQPEIRSNQFEWVAHIGPFTIPHRSNVTAFNVRLGAVTVQGVNITIFR